MDAAKLSRLILYTRDLTKTQTFYSILGIQWLGGSGPEEIGHSGLPISVEKSKRWSRGGVITGFPDLIGDLGHIEIGFILDKNFRPNSIEKSYVLQIDVGNPSGVADQLLTAGLFIDAAQLCRTPLVGVLDPDGRQIILSF